MPATLKTPAFSVMVPIEFVPSPQLMVAVKSLRAAFGLASMKVATVAARAVPSVPPQRRAGGRQRRIRNRGRAGVGRRAATGVLDRHADGVRAFFRINMREAAHREGAIALAVTLLLVKFVGRAITPVNHAREVAGRGAGIGVAEGRAERRRRDALDTTGDGGGPRRQRRIRNRGRAGVGRRATAGVLDRHADGVRCRLPHKHARGRSP